MREDLLRTIEQLAQDDKQGIYATILAQHKTLNEHLTKLSRRFEDPALWATAETLAQLENLRDVLLGYIQDYKQKNLVSIQVSEFVGELEKLQRRTLNVISHHHHLCQVKSASNNDDDDEVQPQNQQGDIDALVIKSFPDAWTIFNDRNLRKTVSVRSYTLVWSCFSDFGFTQMHSRTLCKLMLDALIERALDKKIEYTAQVSEQYPVDPVTKKTYLLLEFDFSIQSIINGYIENFFAQVKLTFPELEQQYRPILIKTLVAPVERPRAMGVNIETQSLVAKCHPLETQLTDFAIVYQVLNSQRKPILTSGLPEDKKVDRRVSAKMPPLLAAAYANYNSAEAALALAQHRIEILNTGMRDYPRAAVSIAWRIAQNYRSKCVATNEELIQDILQANSSNQPSNIERFFYSLRHMFWGLSRSDVPALTKQQVIDALPPSLK